MDYRPNLSFRMSISSVIGDARKCQSKERGLTTIPLEGKCQRFSFLHGPSQHMKHMLSRERLPFTITYFGTMLTTLYFALIVQSTPLTVLCAVGQIIALMWFVASYIPGGQVGLKFITHLCSSAVKTTVSKTLPV